MNNMCTLITVLAVLLMAGSANSAVITDTSQLDLTNVLKAINYGDPATWSVIGTNFVGGTGGYGA